MVPSSEPAKAASIRFLTLLKLTFLALNIIRVAVPEPIELCSLLVPRAEWGGIPHTMRAGMVIKPPPPASVSIKPATNEAKRSNGTSNAGFMLAGNLAVEQSTSSRKQYYWEVYLLMGDPALKTYMGQPKNLRVSFDKEISSRTASVKVNAPAGSYVGISHGNDLLGAGYVCAEGYAVINLTSVPASGEAMVVVSAANAVPYIGTINILP